MLKRFSIFVSIAALFAAAGFGAAFLCAQQSTIDINAPATHANNGKQMYVDYCAQCHGLDGRGGGPIAAALKIPPADLTMLSKNHHGSYPADHVLSVLQFGVEEPAHGTKDMPAWGHAFMRMDHIGNDRSMQQMRISNLVHYVETLQAK